MTIALKKWGNSFGFIIPKKILEKANITEGQEIDVQVTENNEVILKPVAKKRPRYKLSDLLKDHDPSFNDDPVLKEWQNTKPVGNEVW